MTKTKKLPVTDQPETANAEQAEPKTRNVPAVAITQELREALVAYLQAQPYSSVAGLVASLQQSPVIQLTVSA